MATALSQLLRDGIAAAQAKQFDRARALLQPVVDAKPNDPLAWFWLAVASPSGDVAIACLRRVLAIDEGHAGARAALARLLVTEAGKLAAAGNRKEARTVAAEATQLASESEAAWLALAGVTNDRGDRLEAVRRAFAINPQPATRTRLHQALVHQAVMVASSDRAGARVLFREAAALDPTDMHVWQALVQLSDSPSEALDVVRELVTAAPDHQPGRVFLKKALAADAASLETAGDRPQAADRWREITQVDSADLDAWLGLARLTADEEEARRAILAAYDVDADNERVLQAMKDIGESPLDPAAFEAPADAFAHLEQPPDAFALLDGGSDPFAQFDLAVDPFERFAPAPAAVPPPVEAVVPAAEAAPAPPPIEAPAIAAAEAPIAAAEAPITVAEPAPVVPPAVVPPEEPAFVEPSVAAPVAMTPAPTEPVPVDVRAVEPPAAAVAAVPAAPAANGRRTVMVVDDSPTIRKILGLTLERAGYKVLAEPDGESAVERLTQVVPDVILLDIAMPKLDGYEVCKRIRNDPRTARVPVVMLSGKDALFDKVKGHMAGATEYLTKPFEPPAVLAAVSNACQPTAEAVNGRR